MSYVSNTGLQHYHEKMKTLLAGKSDTGHSHKQVFLYGNNTIAKVADDTTSNWGKYGLSYHFYTNSGELTNQPNQYGYVLNVGNGSEVHQLWMTQASGAMLHRGGNGSGWSGSWRTILDSANYTDFAAAKNHTHNYAGSSSPGGGANSVANSLSIQLNGGTATTFNGSAAKSINITPSAIGAATSSHTHSYLPLSGGTVTGSVNFQPASGEGGEIHLCASKANTTENGIVLDQQAGNLRIFGIASADGKTKTGTGTTLVINPYTKSITGGYSFSGNASTATTANSAAKLSTARTIASNSSSLMTYSVTFDGSANVTGYLNPKACSTSVGNTNNYPWHRIATYETNASWNDAMVTLIINGGYNNAPHGIIRITSRTDNGFANNGLTASWLLRYGYAEADLYVCSYTSSAKVFVDVFIKSIGTYNCQVLQVLTAGVRGGMSMPFTLISSREVDNTTTSDKKTSSEVYVSIDAAATALRGAAYSKKVAATDGMTVSNAKTAGSATKATQDSGGQQINTTYIKGISASGTTFTLTKGNGTTSTLSVDCMTNAEIDKLFS